VSLKVKGSIPCPAIPSPFYQSFVKASSDGQYLAYGGTGSLNERPADSGPSPVVVMETGTGKVALVLRLDWGVVRFASDNQYLIAAHDRTGRIDIYSLKSGRPVAQVDLPASHPKSMVLGISPDGRFVAYWTERTEPDSALVQVFDISAGRRVRTLPIPRPVDLRTKFSPDGKWLVVAKRTQDREGYIDLILVDTVAWVPRVIGSLGRTWPIARDLNLTFSKDGTTLVAPQIYGGFTALEIPRPAEAGVGNK
jgi:Tol biopolymer transport system component